MDNPDNEIEEIPIQLSSSRLIEKKMVSIGIVAESKYYTEYRDACTKALGELGWQVKAFTLIENAKSFDIILVVGMAFFSYVPYLRGKTIIGIQGEQLPLPGDTAWSLNRNLKRSKTMSRYYDLIIEWSPQNYLYQTCPVPRLFLPFGAPQPSNFKESEEWDLIFLGNPYGGNGRRIPILNKLKQICNLCPHREAWGDKKFMLINSSKICLNLHQFDQI